MTTHRKIKDLPISERPYEKFLNFGEASLSDADLLAIVIKTGTRNKSSLDVAHRILEGHHGNLLNLYDMSFDEFLEIDGIGQIKAIQLKCIAELSKRIARTNSGYKLSLDNAQTVAEYYMENLRHIKNEHFICAYFDIKNHFLGDCDLAVGSYNCAYVEEREILRIGLEKRASAIILIHNHPSGDCTPSQADVDMTEQIAQKVKYFGFNLRDHIIIGDNRYFSFYEHNIIT